MVTPETEALIKAAIVADIYREAEAAYWLRRADMFEWAKPTASELLGATPDRLRKARENWRRCHDTAESCRARAQVALMPDTINDWHADLELGEAA